jgi:hypothetical protein
MTGLILLGIAAIPKILTVDVVAGGPVMEHIGYLKLAAAVPKRPIPARRQ